MTRKINILTFYHKGKSREESKTAPLLKMARYGLPGDHLVALKFCGGHTSVFTPQ